VRHVALFLAIIAFFFEFLFCAHYIHVINILLLLCVDPTKLYGMVVSLRNMRVFRQLGSVYSYTGPNAVPCLYTDNVVFVDNVQKLNIAFHSLGSEAIDND
jgi:hypothetical protein